MSDTPQGPGWWQASDDKWYPPPRPQMPGDEPAPVTAVAPTTAATYGAPGSGGFPAPGSGGFPAGPPTAVSGPGFAPPGAPGGPGGPGGPPSMPGSGPNPYGVPPVGAPPGTPQNRTPLFIVLGVVVAAALVGLIMLLTSGGDDDKTADPGPSTTAAPGTTTPPSTDTPATTVGNGGGGGGGGEPVAGEIEVLESGFSVYTDQLSEDERLSYGYTIQNNGDQVATSVPVTVAFLDGDGTVVGTADQNVGVLLPGQKMGLGDEPYDVSAGAATMQVTVGEPSSWESPDDYGEITADGITTTVDDYGAPTSSFTAASTYTQQIDSPYAYAVYRNGEGTIVGGSYGFMNFLPANGSTAGEVTSYSSIPDIDNSKTEISVDPGYLF